MLILFVRALILYVLVFLVIRMTGKRQLSDLQPFDLIVTLLIADLASEPMANTAVPLLYGIVPILGLFLMQQAVSRIALKSEKMRSLLCGRPLILIAKGIVQEQALRDARYSLNDLMEQLRGQSAFALSDVEYAILETNGELSILLKGPMQPLTYEAMSLPSPDAKPPFLLVQDGKIHHTALRQAGFDEKWLEKQLRRAGAGGISELLFAFLDGSTLHLQQKEKYGAKASFVEVSEP